MKPQLVIDFDSTIVQCETLDELANIALLNCADRDSKVSAIRALTDQGMAGTLPIDESLKQRIALLSATKEHIETLIPFLISKISPSFLKNRDFLRASRERISIVSAGFIECIAPVAEVLGLSADRVYANTLMINDKGLIEGINASNPLAKAQGKIHLLKSLNLSAPVHVIGDGFTDYEIFKVGAADAFFAFTETVARQTVISQPGISVINSFDQYLSLTSQQ